MRTTHKQILLFSIALLLSNPIVGMGMGFKPMKLKTKKVKPKQLRLSLEEPSAQSEDKVDNDDFGLGKFDDYKNDRKDTKELEFILSCAPQRVHQIIANLQDPNFDKSKVKKQIALVGPTGCGKSELARAIAHAIKRDYYFIPAVYLLSHYRHGTSKNYQKLFKKLEACNPSPVFILDEVSVVGGGRVQRDADDIEIVETLCAFIDEHSQDNDFLMILNTINPDDIPAELRKRCQIVWMQ